MSDRFCFCIFSFNFQWGDNYKVHEEGGGYEGKAYGKWGP